MRSQMASESTNLGINIAIWTTIIDNFLNRIFKEGTMLLNGNDLRHRKIAQTFAIIKLRSIFHISIMGFIDKLFQDIICIRTIALEFLESPGI